jgi:MATE family multidrug resistance protein
MVLMTLLVALTREWLPLLFLGRDAPGAAETISLAAMLLALGATFFIVDGVQTIAAGALRGLNDTRIPMLFAAVSFWAVGFVLSYTFGLTLGLGARGVWIGFTVGLAVYALLLVWRFHLLTQRRYLPALASAE